MITQKLSEEKIVLLLKKRNLNGIDALYDQYGHFIFGLICKIISREDVAEVVLQDTFLKVWNKIDSYALEKGRFITWMMNIARNTAIDMTRSKTYKQTLRIISLDNVPANMEITDMSVRMEHLDIKDFVFGLKKKYSEVIDLIYFKGFTHVEAAKELNLPLGTVKGRVKKAFKDLRIYLEE